MTLAIIIGASLGLVGLLSLIAFCRSRACYFEPGFEPWPSDDRERFEGSSFDPIAAEAGERRVMTIEGVEFPFRYCPPGKFVMGGIAQYEGDDGPLGEEPCREVILTQGFWAMETPTTQKQWEAVAGFNPSEFEGDDCPVECVSWNDCVKFASVLNERFTALPDGWIFCLPTEAQWEYACKAGTTTPFFWGDALNGDRANCDGSEPVGDLESGARLWRTSPVRSYEPNPWGLYDAIGNVDEWCLDCYDAYSWYSEKESAPIDPAPAVDPVVAPEDAPRFYRANRVYRGGSWHSEAWDCYSFCRDWCGYAVRSSCLGARFVLIPRDAKALSLLRPVEGKLRRRGRPFST
ncbi:MAG: formylglycine-generating enzyme family protein [Thermoguttaceae bacterium]|nr:formylglycine-generating enzyme family protein [Thermoguttaceae bacterium]